MHQSLAEAPAQELQLTPTKEGEYRCGAIENKVTHAQQETAACMQLQANMLLLCSKLLVHKVLNDTDSADSTLLTSYGVLLGPTYALKVLKMTLNFDNGGLLYEELFKLDACLHYPAFVDMCIFFVLGSKYILGYDVLQCLARQQLELSSYCHFQKQSLHCKCQLLCNYHDYCHHLPCLLEN